MTTTVYWLVFIVVVVVPMLMAWADARDRERRFRIAAGLRAVTNKQGDKRAPVSTSETGK